MYLLDFLCDFMEVTMSEYYYGCAVTDEFLFTNPKSLPRYGNLARKVMMHYLGERYNPHLHGLVHEPFLRQMIKEFVSYKVFNRLSEYDWEWLDQSFRKYFNGCFDLDLPFDQNRIQAGLKPDALSPFSIKQTVTH